MEMEPLLLMGKVLFILANGKMVLDTDKEKLNLQVVHYMKDHLLMEINKEKEK